MANAIKSAVAWLISSVAGKATLKILAKTSVLALFLIGLAVTGMLPRSPLRIAILPLANMVDSIPYFRYISYFVPTVPILAVLYAWLNAVIGFHILKIYLRKGGFIK